MCEFTKSDIKTSQWVKMDRQAEGFGKGGKREEGKEGLKHRFAGCPSVTIIRKNLFTEQSENSRGGVDSCHEPQII